MAAPSYKNSIVWGSILNIDSTHQGRIGLYKSQSIGNTQVRETIEIWFWSKYWTSDSSNTLYADWDSTSASTSQGSVSINNHVPGVTDDGDGWADEGMVLIKTMSKLYDKGTSAAAKNFAAKLTGISGLSGTMSVTSSFTIPALARYAVTYSANGGTGEPSGQTKYYGKTLTLSTTKPTRTGYTFVGWGTSANDITSDYAAGASYTENADITLYAIWKKTISLVYMLEAGNVVYSESETIYNAVTECSFKIIDTEYTMKGCKFLGWSQDPSAKEPSYLSGDEIVLSSSTTLYAVWKKNNQMALNQNGQIRKGKPWLNGRTGVPWMKINGRWRRGGN